MNRVTVAECQQRLGDICGIRYEVERDRNKGKVGHVLETLLEIPHSSACLDCADGEIKCFPLKKKGSKLVPKETVAVTMCNKEKLLEEEFEDSRVYKKLENTLFVPYRWTRDGEEVQFYKPICFTPDHPLWTVLHEDYLQIQEKAEEGIMKGSIGTYLQTRTKGAGHGTTSRAFYLRTKFLKALFEDGFQE